MSHAPSAQERLEELHIARLLFGLSTDEEREWDQLIAEFPVESFKSFEAVIAALDLSASSPTPEALPALLRSAVRTSADVELKLPAAPARGGAWRSFVPWLAAAACLVFAVATWLFTRPADPSDVAQRRAELLREATDLIQVDWSDGPTPIDGATGDVVWSPAKQTGFMRFRGLPINVPNKEQYQLWIFDRNQSDKTPVDGGVFDVTSQGEVVVPIDAKLHVQDAFLFAITIEKPGGVVVSSRERLPLLAKVGDE